ncbi:MAG TPA: ATP-binding protein, partial [Parvibaculum sp.]
CRRVLNRRSDVARAIEGANLRNLIVGASGRNLFDLLQEEPQIRHLRGQFAEGPAAAISTDNALYISGVSREEDFSAPPTYIGTLTCTSPCAASHFANEATATQTQMRASRHREERHRIEDDAMLEGLRLLLDARTPREKLIRLTTLLCENMGGEEALIVEPGYDGRPRILLPESRTLDLSAGALVDEIAADTAPSHMKLYGEEDPLSFRIRDALGLSGGHIAAFALPLRVQTAYLLCATGAARGLSADGVAFAERFAFILRQALLLREEQAQLAQTAKMAALGQMSASIAHELKQPLNTISLATQNLEALLSSPKFDPAAVEAKIARVLAQVDRAANVIDRMRRFGRKSLGESGTVSVHDLVEGVLLMIRHVLERAGVEITLDLAPNLSLRADELQLEQVLTNLVQNAVDAISGIGSRQQPGEMGAGKIRIAAFVSPEERDEVVLRVEDNGPGFPAGIVERALEPFFTTKPAEQGTGLGLAICDAIIREGGGRLTLGNHEGGGFVALTMPAAIHIFTVPSESP